MSDQKPDIWQKIEEMRASNDDLSFDLPEHGHVSKEQMLEALEQLATDAEERAAAAMQMSAARERARQRLAELEKLEEEDDSGNP